MSLFDSNVYFTACYALPDSSTYLLSIFVLIEAATVRHELHLPYLGRAGSNVINYCNSGLLINNNCFGD